MRSTTWKACSPRVHALERHRRGLHPTQRPRQHVRQYQSSRHARAEDPRDVHHGSAQTPRSPDVFRFPSDGDLRSALPCSFGRTISDHVNAGVQCAGRHGVSSPMYAIVEAGPVRSNDTPLEPGRRLEAAVVWTKTVALRAANVMVPWRFAVVSRSFLQRSWSC